MGENFGIEAEQEKGDGRRGAPEHRAGGEKYRYREDDRERGDDHSRPEKEFMVSADVVYHEKP